MSATLEFAAHFLLCLYRLSSCNKLLYRPQPNPEAPYKKTQPDTYTVVECLHMLCLSLLSLFPTGLLLPRWFSFLIALHLVSPHSFPWTQLCSWTNLSASVLHVGSQVFTTLYRIQALENLAPGSGSSDRTHHRQELPWIYFQLARSLFSPPFILHGFQRASKLSRGSPWESSPNAWVKPLVSLFLSHPTALQPATSTSLPSCPGSLAAGALRLLC